jgi:hypothetical protein
MDDNLLQRMREHITKNEGVWNRPYKDSQGNLTAGTGFLVSTEKAFTALPFQVKDAKTGQLRPASPAEKSAEFTRVKSLSRTELDAEARAGKGFELPKPAIDAKLDSEITTRIDKIKGEIGAADWNNLSDGQKTAVLDIHYANGSLEEFDKLKAAIKSGDAEAMAKESSFGNGNYNWERLARNKAEILGVSQEEGRRMVEKEFDKKYKNIKFDGPVAQPPKPVPRPEPDKRTNGGGDSEQQPKLTLLESTSLGGLSTSSMAALEIPPATSVKGDLLETANTQDALIGGLANEAAETAKATDGPEQTANIDSHIQSMREMAAQPIDHPGKSAMLKPVDKWTESEMKDVLNSAQGDFTGWQSGDPLKARMYETVQDWHSHVYGDGTQQTDGGKPVEPSPIKPLNIVAMPHTTPQGEDLWKASARIGDKIGTIAETDGYDASVKAMQRGINMLNDSTGQPERSPAWGDYTPQEALKVDGDYGPKTDFALKDTLARHGETKADDALALGRFGNFADQVKQSGKADGLDQAAKDIFGPLYGGSEAPNGVLQETLNKVGGTSIDNWQDLKVDDWIGPKTTDAFAQVMDNTDPEDFTRSFGSGLGLL